MDNESEIFVQRLSATGAEVGTDDARISTNGPSQNPAYDAGDPVIAFNSTANEYLVVWSSDDDTETQIDEDLEIFAQRLSAAGDEVGPDDQRISSMGPARNDDYDALEATVTYNSVANEYLVAWNGTEPPLDPFELEVFGQRLAADGTEIGTDDQRISAMGPDGNVSYNGAVPSATYNPTVNEYLVAWSGVDDAEPPAGSEIFAQRLSSTGDEVAPDDQRISVMGPDGGGPAGAVSPSAAFNSVANEYLFAWRGYEPPATAQKTEIYVRSMLGADPPLVQPPTADTTLDGAAINLAKKLKIKGKELKVALAAGCAEACTSTASGEVAVKPSAKKVAAKAKRYKLAPAIGSSAAGAQTTLTLKLQGSKKKRKKVTGKIVRSLRRGAKAKASISVTSSDAAANSLTTTGSASLKAKR